MGDPFKLIIEDDEGHRNVVPIDLGEVTIGRHDNNAIRLNERNVSRQHMRLLKENGHVYAEDLDSYNGVFINGNRVTSRAPIHEGDLIRVGDFHLELRGEGLARRSEETTQKTLVPDLDSTHPEIRMPGGSDSRAPTGPLTQERTEPGTPAPPPAVAESNAAEPTAIIRLDQIQDLQAQKSSAGATITGDKPRLICVSTNLAGQEFPITKTEAVIGRTEDNDIQLDHRSVSRHHAKIVTSGTNYKIVDLGSANGTLVNDEQYAQLALKSGDLIELGHVKLRFVPPGASYTFTPEERATIAGKGVVQDDVPTKTAGGGLLEAAKRNPFGAITAGLALVAVLVLIVVLAASGGSGSNDADLDRAVSEAGAGSDASRFVEKAKEFMEEREWRKAEKLLQLGIEKDPSYEPAIDLLSKVEQEQKAKKSFDSANRAIKGSNWNAAWNFLSEIPDDSVYNREAQSLREQVGGALVTEKVNQGRDALKNNKRSKAKELLEEAQAIDPDHQEVEAFQSELESSTAEQQVAEAKEPEEAPPSRPSRREEKRAPAPQAKSKKKEKDREKQPERREPERPAPEPRKEAAAAPADEDPKALYKKGIAALQGGQTDKAIEAFNKCVQADRGYCLCYRALGIAYARAQQGQKAARYYRLYIKYCPTAKDADQVRKLLGDYGDG